MIGSLRFSPSRVALGYVALSALVLAVFAVPLWYAWQTNLSTFKAYVDGADQQRWVDVFEREGASGLAAAMTARAAGLPSDEIMVFADASNARLAGNLPAWPAQVPDAPGTYGLVIDVGGGATMRIVGSHVVLPGGHRLLLGRESILFNAFIERFWYGITGATAIVLLLGVGIGWLIRKGLLTEVEAISRTAAAIAEGDLSRPLATRGGSPELDLLARTVNAMLERLARQNAQLAGARGALEGMVAQRTAELARANESLQLSEERYARAMEASDAGYWDWNVLTGEIFLSARMKELVGFPPDARFADRADFVARLPMHPDDRTRVAEVIAATLASDADRYEVDYRVALPSGEVRWARARGKVYRDEAGRALRVAGSLTDDTERKLAEEALRRSEDRFALAVAGSNDGIWDWNVLTDEMFFSDRAQLLYGLQPGPTVRPRAEWRQMVKLHPRDVEAQRAAVEDYLAGRAPRYEGEWRVRHADGRYRWVRIRGRCLRDESGRPTRMAGSVSDIDEQKRAAAALRLSEERYARAMEASDAGHWDWNVVTDEMFQSARMKELLGFAADAQFTDRTGLLARIPFLPGERERLEEGIRASLTDPSGRYMMDFRVAPRPGEVRWLRSYGKVFRDERGTAVRMTGSIADITDRKAAEDEVRLGKEELQRVMASVSDYLWSAEVSPDGSFAYRYYSPVVERITGWPPQRLLESRERWVELLHPLDRPWVDEAFGRLVSGATERVDVEYRIVRPDGRLRWVRDSARGTRVDDGRILLDGVVGDITERKLAEETVRESEARFRMLTELSSDWYWRQDENLRFTYLSSDVNELAGYPAESSLGKTRWELPRLTPLSSSWAEHQAELAARRPFRDFEYCRDAEDGTRLYISVSGAPVFDEAGRFKGYQGIGRSITERKRIEEALRKSEARFRALTELSSDWYWRQDEDFRFTYLSTDVDQPDGYPGGSAVGRTRWELPDVVPLAGSWHEHRAALDAHKPFRDFEYSRPAGDGTTRYISVSGAPIFDEQGCFRGYQGTGRDITERMLAANALRESEARFRTLTELSSDWYWKQDENLRFVSYVPPEVGTRSGVPAGASLGRTRWEFANVTPLSSTWEEHQAVLAARQPFRDFEYVRVDDNGTPHYTVISGVPTFDRAGRFTGYEGVGRNISERRRFEEELRLSEERYARAMEATEEGHWEWDVATDEMFLSQRMKQMLGFPPDARFASRADFFERLPIHPDDRQRVAEAREAGLLRATSRYEIEYRVVPRPGEVRWVRRTGKLFLDEHGVPLRMSGSFSDITDRKRIEEALRLSEARYARAMEATEEGHWEWDVVTDDIFVSGRVNRMFGYPEDARFDKRADFVANAPYHPDDREHVAASIRAGLSGTSDRHDFEYRIVLPPGRERWVRARWKILRDPGGAPLRVTGALVDITDRKRAEEELRSRQDMLDLAQKAARAVAFEWWIGAGEGQNRWSPDLETMYGLAPGSYDGTYETWRKLVFPDDWPAVKAAIKRANETGDVAAEYRVVHQDGGVHWLQAKGRMFFDAAGAPARMVGFMLDVTERRHAEEELRRLERQLRQAQRLEAMGTLSGGIAHDFNNILGAILGYGEMALRDAAKGSRLRRDLESIMTAGERGRALVERILAFSRSSVDERVAVDVERVAREALDQLAAKLPADVTIAPRLRAGRAAVRGDPTQVHQVLMNLATNAVQAMPAGGTLRVLLRTARVESPHVATTRTVEPGEYVVLEVADSGIGMSPEILERIFDPFFTTKEVGVGTGLGLSLVHGIVTELGGAVDVSSAPGKGSTFTVYLPRAGDAAEVVEGEMPDLPRGHRERVLVVDDEEPLVRIATETLEGLGYRPTGFTSSAAALETFRADPAQFDAVITDERMPGVSGSALIRALRELRPEIPILLVSGYLGAAVVRRAREAGADEVLKKPFSANALATALARVLQLEKT